MRSALVALMTLVAASAARAELADGWPQARRDPALTAMSPEPSIASPTTAWALRVGEALGGEPVASGCAVFVGNGGGRVVRVNARSGGPEWATPAPLRPCQPPAVADSSLALDATGGLHAGLAGDEGLIGTVDVVCSIVAGCISYSIDNNEYPPGLDLMAELSPTYMTWPINPCTGAPVVVTDLPSSGDVRYERGPIGEPFYLGAWGVDDGLIEPWMGCTHGGAYGLAPWWPRSRRLAGGVVMRADDGAVSGGTSADVLADRTVVALLADGAAWTQVARGGWRAITAWGRILATRADGSESWQARCLATQQGASARDVASASLFTSMGVERIADHYNAIVQALATAVESYSIDNNAYPPTGELVDLITPTYLASLPANPLTGEPARWSLTPSPGDYSYEALGGRLEYRVGWWTSSGTLAAIFETGRWVEPAVDQPPSVERRLEANGSLAWRMPLPGPSDPTPVMLAGGAVLLAQDGILLALAPGDGAELWRVPLGAAIDRPLALLPDGGIVGASSDGWLLAIDGGPGGSVRWRYAMGASLGPVAPTVTSDGVTYLGDLAGRLHAVRADGSELWTRDLAGPATAGLTTSAIPHEGWLYIGRSDGVLVALAPEDPGWRPPALPGVLRAWRTGDPAEARLEWDDSPLPDVLGAHYHLARASPSAQGPWTQALEPHAFVATTWTDASPGERLVFYRLELADCGENESAAP